LNQIEIVTNLKTLQIQANQIFQRTLLILNRTLMILYLLSGDDTLSGFLHEKQVYISFITELELIGYPDITGKEQKQITNFLKDCAIIEINDDIKSIYVELRRKYHCNIFRPSFNNC